MSPQPSNGPQGGQDVRAERDPAQPDRTWQDNADEFAALDKGEGWAFAVLVACSVELPGRGGDRKSDQTSNRKFDGAKVTAERFADRVAKAANDYRPDMLPSVELKPDDVLTAWHPATKSRASFRSTHPTVGPVG